MAFSKSHLNRWAELMRKVWGVEVLDCLCGGKRKFVEEVTAKEQIRQRLERLGLWKEPPSIPKARPGRQARWFERHAFADGVDPPTPDDAV